MRRKGTGSQKIHIKPHRKLSDDLRLKHIYTKGGRKITQAKVKSKMQFKMWHKMYFKIDSSRKPE